VELLFEELSMHAPQKGNQFCSAEVQRWLVDHFSSGYHWQRHEGNKVPNKTNGQSSYMPFYDFNSE